MRNFIVCTPLNIITMIKSKRIKWTRHVERMVEMRNAYRILDIEPERKRPLGGPRRRLKDNIYIYIYIYIYMGNF
jgi:hypothetical protein